MEELTEIKEELENLKRENTLLKSQFREFIKKVNDELIPNSCFLLQNSENFANIFISQHKMFLNSYIGKSFAKTEEFAKINSTLDDIVNNFNSWKEAINGTEPRRHSESIHKS
ncbi:MAG: hypothetical protein H7A25_18450 [Leptospiraceae bacterium]|nr:hypothetical protein [Leptospiraceae bacterium]MCP5501888.1 hypothetical protein [Leptospiraceae bacterium]